MFFLPYGDENPTGRVSYVNYTIIIINFILFLGLGFSSLYKDIVQNFAFIPDEAVPYTYFTSIFLHANLFHLLGNMLYLYIAGDNVEDKLGHIGYLLFYLLTGAAANFFHQHMVSEEMMSIPTLGASGAISAVLGAYVILFPKNKIKFFYFVIIFFFIKMGTFKLASFWAIGLWFILQLFSHGTTRGASAIAYGAHLGGFIVGVVFVSLLVLIGVIDAYWKKEHSIEDIQPENPEQSDINRPDFYEYPAYREDERTNGDGFN